MAPVNVRPDSDLTIAQKLAEQLGLNSPVGKKLIKCLYGHLTMSSNAEILGFYQKWRELFEGECGYDFRKFHISVSEELSFLDHNQVDPGSLLYVIHSYLVLISKIFIVEISARYLCKPKFSWLRNVANCSPQDFRENLISIENGDAWEQLGLEKLAGTPYYAWLFIADIPEFTKLTREMIKVLSSSLNEILDSGGFLPGRNSGDIMSELYFALVPAKVRHDLGEYYTPRWLAQFVVKESGFRGNPDTRVLDPNCGSGAILMEVLSAVNAFLGQNGNDPREFTKRILENVVGFDINPLSVFLARVNYLLFLAQGGYLDSNLTKITIPIYQFNILTVSGENIEADNPKFHNELGPFDFILGNPPWVGWESLNPEIRKKQVPLWKHYGLFHLNGMEAMLGGGRKDLSMLVSYKAIADFLREGGRLAFLITATVFRSKAGGGFRRLQLDDTPLQLITLHDFQALQPFEGATTQTAFFVIKKGDPTRFPVQGTSWSSSGQFSSRATWAGLNDLLISTPIEILPAQQSVPTSRFLFLPPGSTDFSRYLGQSFYSAREGVNPLGAQGIYILKVKELEEEIVTVTNCGKIGKKKFPIVSAGIEPDLLYPVARSADLKRDPWILHSDPSDHYFFLLTQDPETQRGLEISAMERHYPLTLSYLRQFEKDLTDRKGLWRYFSRKKGSNREMVLIAPFYSIFNVTTDILAPYKVIWKRMGNYMSAAILGTMKLKGIGEKPILPLDIYAFVPCRSYGEACFICAILNSKFARKLLSLVTDPGKSYASPNILNFLNLPRFDPENSLHRDISEKARECDSLAKNENTPISPDLQNILENLVEKLYSTML